jgi:hypothetical protein
MINHRNLWAALQPKNPFSKILIKICCAAFGYGAMFADTKALTLAGLEIEEGRIGGVMRILVG